MNQPPASRSGSAVVTLPTDTQIQITRVFDAPAEIVFPSMDDARAGAPLVGHA